MSGLSETMQDESIENNAELYEEEAEKKISHVGFIIVCALILTVFVLCYFLSPLWAMFPLIAIVIIEPAGYKTEKKVCLIIAILIIGVFSYFFGFTGGGSSISGGNSMDPGGGYYGGGPKGAIIRMG